jgi:hypothetical protein
VLPDWFFVVVIFRMSVNVAIFRRVLADFCVFLLFLECLEILLFLEGCCRIGFCVFVIFRMSVNVAIFRRVLADFCVFLLFLECLEILLFLEGCCRIGFCVLLFLECL